MPASEPSIQDSPDDPAPDEPDSIRSSEAIQVAVVNHTDQDDADLGDWLKTQVCRAIALCELTQAQLTIAIVADEEMAQLHEQYTGIAGTTDVLTFDLLADAAAPTTDPATGITAIEGDIVVCLDEANRQAKQHGHDVQMELLLYAVHGLMHLLGEDDHTEEDYQRMHAREDALLIQMGIGPLFDPDRDPNP